MATPPKEAAHAKEAPAPKMIRIEALTTCLYDGATWNPGMVFEAEPNYANYQIGMRQCKLSEDELTPRPELPPIRRVVDLNTIKDVAEAMGVSKK